MEGWTYEMTDDGRTEMAGRADKEGDRQTDDGTMYERTDARTHVQMDGRANG